jgi:hypothetical protein
MTSYSRTEEEREAVMDSLESVQRPSSSEPCGSTSIGASFATCRAALSTIAAELKSKVSERKDENFVQYSIRFRSILVRASAEAVVLSSLYEGLGGHYKKALSLRSIPIMDDTRIAGINYIFGCLCMYEEQRWYVRASTCIYIWGICLMLYALYVANTPQMPSDPNFSFRARVSGNRDLMASNDPWKLCLWL